MVIAVDFDGTIVEHEYPAIGRERPGAVRVLRRLQQEIPDLRLILWTVREGDLLDQALRWCEQRDLHFYAVNSNYTDETAAVGVGGGRKVTADIYIDDRSLGGIPDWNAIYAMVKNSWTWPQYIAATTRPAPDDAPERRSFLSRLFGR